MARSISSPQRRRPHRQRYRLGRQSLVPYSPATHSGTIAYCVTAYRRGVGQRSVRERWGCMLFHRLLRRLLHRLLRLLLQELQCLLLSWPRIIRESIHTATMSSPLSTPLARPLSLRSRHRLRPAVSYRRSIQGHTILRAVFAAPMPATRVRARSRALLSASR